MSDCKGVLGVIKPTKDEPWFIFVTKNSSYISVW
jgi:hypothetical protein